MQQMLDVTMDGMQIVKRLLDQFSPINYKLSISLNRLNRTFEGSVTIDGALINDSDKISLHSKQLVIKSAKIDTETASISFEKDDELILSAPGLQKGKHQIRITFSGTISDAMQGIYPCYYEHDGIKKELLATQFESHHAREAFPCIDEPAAKATYDLTLETELDVTVLSNMPIKDQRAEDDRLITVFETTPIMSSYLLAWVVGELHKKTAVTKNGVEINVWATLAQPENNLDFALDIATRSTDFFDEYFSTPYPLPKSDYVALPDFSSGAMENWGLQTYREIALLVDPETTSVSTKQYVATVITHETSHQWFGNLVTMEWWDDLWLNESFASLVEYSAVDALEPGWNIWFDFASNDSVVALRRDSLAGVQPVQTGVNHPDEIMSLFDGAIVYAKGARLIKMLIRYIGEDVFRAGMKEYFRTHAYRNTVSADLWKSLSSASGIDIGSFMNSWIKQPGFPVVHVSKSGNTINLRQERLVGRLDEKSDSLWPITLNSNNSDLPKIMDQRSLVIDNVEITEPLRLNTSSDAHFITHYDNYLMSKLIERVAAGKLPTIDRMQLLNEQMLLANAGIISYGELIPLLDAYKNESTEAVWGIIGLAIGELKKFVEDDEAAEKKLRELAGSLARNQYERLGWINKSGENEEDIKLRSVIIGLMIYSEDPEVIKMAIDNFKSTDLEKLNPELRPSIISAAVRYEENDIQMIDSLFKKYQSTDSAELRQDISVGLTSSKNAEVNKLILDKLTDTSIIRTQDTARWVVYTMRNRYAREMAWQWIRDNWEWIKKKFFGSMSYDDYPRYAASALVNKKQLDEYIEFFTPKKAEPVLTRAIEIGINEIRNRVDIIERDSAAVKQALKNL